MKFSIVIPTYNRSKKLANCLDAIFAQKDYSGNFEVIVVDDYSTDDTLEVLDSYKKIARSQLLIVAMPRDGGPVVARNEGVRNAQGEYIVFTDDDCRPHPDWLKRFSNALIKNPDVSVVQGWQVPPKELRRKFVYARYELWNTKLEKHFHMSDTIISHPPNTAGTNNLCVLTSAFREIEGFNESLSFPGAEDKDLLVRLYNEGYNIMYSGIVVDHHQDYSFKAVYRQQVSRGKAYVAYQKLTGNKVTRFQIRRYQLKLLLRFFPSVFKLGPSLAWAVLRMQMAQRTGMLKALKGDRQ